MTPLLELVDLACSPGGRPLFDAVSASVPAGWMLRVDGPNGSGKTSLLRLVCGLGSAAAGQVRWRGQDIATQRERFHAELLYLGHAPALKDELSASDNLQAACRLAGMACSASDAAAALARAGLRGRKHLPARALSQGQRKRAGLARLVLAAEATLWVLDEPFNALDATATGWLHAEIDRHLARGGIVVLTSHEARAWPSGRDPITVTLGRTATMQAAGRPTAEARATSLTPETVE